MSASTPVDNPVSRESLCTTDGVPVWLRMVQGVTGPSNNAISRLGGVATWAELIAEMGRAGLRRALDYGSIIRVGRGRYVIGACPSIAVAPTG